ncbi:penicillin-binding protein 1C [Aestuariivirga sp.]|uniref:penicillin-binding protein 1C n=1 Tax=Aestuariivirga sp. TaxID=2650926 RepID=UPI0039E4B732
MRLTLKRPPAHALYACVLGAFLLVNAVGFPLSEFIRRLGPPPLGERVTYSSLVVDRDGKLLRPFTTSDGYWRLPLSARDVDPRYLAMLLAYEDKRFYEHRGVDPYAMLRAMGQALWHGHIVSGGSTLTMQVARLLEPRPARTFSDKLAEMIRAVQIERRLSKAQILDLYLALAPAGGNVEGIRAASLAYFGKEPKHLSTAESALLVALPQSPETRRPDRFPEAAKAARNRVVARLAAAHIINSDQAEAAEAEAAPGGRQTFPMLAAQLAEKLAKPLADGRVVKTTLLRSLQSQLEDLAREKATAIGGGVSAAIIVVKNDTGEVIAHVGGVGFLDSRGGMLDLANAIRSPGSTLKPFIYGLAFEDGIVHTETLVDDRAVRYGAYAPQNFDDSFHGTVTVRTALQQSLNVPALQVLDAVGPDRLVARLKNAGVDLVLPSGTAPGLAVGLGGAGTRLTDLATLYAALARGGEPLRLSWQPPGATPDMPHLRRLMEPQAAWMVSDVLLGSPAPLNAMSGRIAFKTGTSYGYRDAWSVGYDGANTIAVWVGRPDGAAVPGLVGRIAAAPILFDAFQRVSATRAKLPPPPEGVIFARTSELPANLQRFRPNGLPQVADAGPGNPPLAIAFPPDGAKIDLDGAGEDAMLVLKALGGVPPFTWLVDGVPVVTKDQRRESYWDQPGHGFSRLSVIDATGATATAMVRIQ